MSAPTAYEGFRETVSPIDPELFGHDRKRKVYEAKREPMQRADWRRLGWSDEEAERFVMENPQTKTVCYVIVQADNGEDRYELRHHKQHSPTGFDWGYDGSGPTELARCILIDHLNLHDQAEDASIVWNQVPPLDYHEFRRTFIAGAPKEGFVLHATEIDAWVQEQEALLSE